MCKDQGWKPLLEAPDPSAPREALQDKPSGHHDKYIYDGAGLLGKSIFTKQSQLLHPQM